MSGSRHIGVVLLNLGGPYGQEAVAPFLRSLLSDPDVMPLPWPLRPLLARRIARKRAPVVAEHYRRLGGGSPIEEQTRAQVAALQDALGPGFLVRFAFRHAPPRARQAVRELAAAGVRQLVALPAYPHWSGSTTGSALRDLERAAALHGIQVCPVRSYPEGRGYLEALAQLTRPLLSDGARVVLSAHGLPESFVRRGDPYVDEVRATARALADYLPAGTECTLAFQSRMGRGEWTRPYLVDEIRRLGKEGAGAVVVVPLSFACENLETLYELDVEVAGLARSSGIASYRRVPAPGNHDLFIDELATQVQRRVTAAGWEITRGA